MLKIMKRYSNLISQRESEILLSHVFNCSRTDLYTHSRPIIDNGYDALVERRLKGEPLQYILGSSEFMGLDFIVTNDALIPRPETEILVKEILSITDYPSPVIVLDLCTGSGNIAISLAKNIQNADIIAADISENALDIAKKNAKKHNVDRYIRFYQSDLFNGIPFDKKHKFDIIVCNPPYIKTSDIGLLQKEIQYEPSIALDGGSDGLEFYRRIKDSSKRYLKKTGFILLEIGYGQTRDVMDIFSNKEGFKTDKIIKDFSGIDRALWISLL